MGLLYFLYIHCIQHICMVYIWSIVYISIYVCVYIYIYTHIYVYIQAVPGGKDLTSVECSLGQTILI